MSLIILSHWILLWPFFQSFIIRNVTAKCGIPAICKASLFPDLFYQSFFLLTWKLPFSAKALSVYNGTWIRVLFFFSSLLPVILLFVRRRITYLWILKWKNDRRWVLGIEGFLHTCLPKDQTVSNAPSIEPCGVATLGQRARLLISLTAWKK